MSDQEDRQQATEEQLDDKIRTPGENIGEVETRDPLEGDGAAPVFPEPTGTDTGQPTSTEAQ
jgi:hypothetical protein